MVEQPTRFTGPKSNGKDSSTEVYKVNRQGKTRRCDYRRPSEGERETYRDESGFFNLLLDLCVIETKASNMALAELGNKNNATVTEASDH